MDSRILDESISSPLITSWVNWMPLLCGQADYWLQWAWRPNRNWGWGYLKSGRCQVTAEEWENPIHGLDGPGLWLASASLFWPLIGQCCLTIPARPLFGGALLVKSQISDSCHNNKSQWPSTSTTCILHSGFLSCSFYLLLIFLVV